MAPAWAKVALQEMKLPRALFSSIVVCPQYHGVIVSKEQRVSYVDDSAKAWWLSYPIKHDIDVNWNDMKICLAPHLLQWARALRSTWCSWTGPQNRKASREKKIQMFETSNISVLHGHSGSSVLLCLWAYKGFSHGFWWCILESVPGYETTSEIFMLNIAANLQLWLRRRLCMALREAVLRVLDF